MTNKDENYCFILIKNMNQSQPSRSCWIWTVKLQVWQCQKKKKAHDTVNLKVMSLNAEISNKKDNLIGLGQNKNFFLIKKNSEVAEEITTEIWKYL